MWKQWMLVVLGLWSLAAVPVAEACGPHGCGGGGGGFSLRAQAGGFGVRRGFPVLRAIGRFGVGVARGAGRLAVGAARAIGGAGRWIGRALFGRRFRR